MNRFLAVGVAVFVIALGGCSRSDSDSASIDSDTGGIEPGTAGIEPKADDALQRMSRELARSSALSFWAATVMEEPADTGQMVQLHSQNKVVLRRPDRLYVENRPGNEVWKLWHKGRRLTIADVGDGLYASQDVPAPNEKVADQLVEDYDLVLPLADLLFPEPYKVLTANVQTGVFLGEHRVGGVMCDHLLFTQEDIDWQIWVEQGPSPMPRKLVIDYKLEPGRPQFSAVMSDWNLSAPAGDMTFDPVLTQGARKVGMAQLLGTRPGR